MDQAELADKISLLHWWHRINLQGIVTPGLFDNYEVLSLLGLPERLDGLTVLDIGAADGFYSFEAERRGAARVVAVDHQSWNACGGYVGTKDAFNLSRQVLNSNVEDLDIDLYDLNPERFGTFDVVLFMGVLYHLRNPLLGLERAAKMTRERMIVETHINPGLASLAEPVMIFYPGAEYNNDATNWWGPNVPLVEAMLYDVGFSRIEHQVEYRDRFICHAVKE